MIKCGKYFSLILVISFLFSFSVKAQEAAYQENQMIYEKLYQGGIVFHTSGFGLTFKQSKSKTAFLWTDLGINISTLKHPKERKRAARPFERANTYVYGKTHSVLLIRPFWGRRKIVFEKRRKRGVEGGYVYSIGPSIALAKPIYYDILSTDGSLPNPKTEKFDIDKHSPQFIIGKSSSLMGLDELDVYPGIYTKFGFTFEYSNERERIKAIEVGFALDTYPYKAVPIMAHVNNSKFHLNFYVSLQYGKKFFR